jgi:UDP-N-acetylmuramyl pentapeptide phosphotransferase/UDP-N-acetylglucosamine-1-phosphate transferase
MAGMHGFSLDSPRGQIMLDPTTLGAAFAMAALISFLACELIVATQRWHGALSLDSDLDGKQKFHKTPVPRIGGAGLMIGIVSGLAWIHLGGHYAAPGNMHTAAAALLGSSLPVFAIGLIEDLCKRVSVRLRFGLTLGSALLACWWLDAVLLRVDLPLVDDLLAYLPVAVVVTAVAVTGVTNSVNIIDGFNGIAGSTVIAMLSGMAFLGWRFGDALVLELALLGVAATIGFLLVNYPRGRLFMGDGGAYFLGFWCAEIAVLLVCRHPAISAWQVLAIYAYPVTEVLYSMFRKRILRKMSPTVPDRLHLHMLLYRRCVCRLLPRNEARPWLRNAAVTWLIAPWTIGWTVLVVALGTSARAAALLLALQVLAYVIVYVRLLRGRWHFRPSVIFGLVRSARAPATSQPVQAST